MILSLLFVILPRLSGRMVHLARNDNDNSTISGKGLTCPEEEASHRRISGTILVILGGLGCIANLVVMGIVITKKQLRNWSLGLVFHQCCVDMARASILLPLGRSLLECLPVTKCSLLETAFLLLATVSTVSISLIVYQFTIKCLPCVVCLLTSKSVNNSLIHFYYHCYHNC